MTSTSTYYVEGMTCAGCAGKVSGTVEKLAGVTGIDIDLASGGLTLTTIAPIKEEAIRKAVEEAGYKMAPEIGS